MNRSKINVSPKKLRNKILASRTIPKTTLPAVLNTPSPKLDIADEGCKVVRKKVTSVILYEVKENELDVLEKGRQSDIFLNFSIFCYSTMLTCIASLFTSTFDNEFYKIAFFCVTVIGAILGTILLILWWKGKDSVKDIIKTIRARKSDD